MPDKKTKNWATKHSLSFSCIIRLGSYEDLCAKYFIDFLFAINVPEKYLPFKKY